MASDIQQVRHLASDLVDYISIHMHRPDVAANLRNWGFAAICRHLDSLTNVLRAKDTQINSLKDQLVKCKEECTLQKDKVNSEQRKNQEAEIRLIDYSHFQNTSQETVKYYENRIREIQAQKSSINGDSEKYKAMYIKSQADLQKVQANLQKVQQLLAQKDKNLQKQGKDSQALKARLRQLQENKNVFKSAAYQFESQLQAKTKTAKDLQNKVKKLQVKLKNQKQGINPVTYESMFDEQN